MPATKNNTASPDELERILIVQNKMGIHARPAAMMVRVSNKYNSAEVWVQKDSESVNGKSIMGLMMLAAGNGAKLRFRVTGAGAEALLREMEELFARKFEEA
jgi:phosphocarrier protein HPr